jgi:hypothetical protein
MRKEGREGGREGRKEEKGRHGHVFPCLRRYWPKDLLIAALESKRFALLVTALESKRFALLVAALESKETLIFRLHQVALLFDRHE